MNDRMEVLRLAHAAGGTTEEVIARATAYLGFLEPARQMPTSTPEQCMSMWCLTLQQGAVCMGDEGHSGEHWHQGPFSQGKRVSWTDELKAKRLARLRAERDRAS